MSENIHWRKLQNNDFFGEYVLPLEGTGEMVIRILNVEKSVITNSEGKKEDATIATVENQKPWILNNINQRRISMALGSSNVADWDGKYITVYREKWLTAVDLIKQKTQTVETLRAYYEISPESEKALLDAASK